MYSNNIVNFQESTTILNDCTKKSGNLLNEPRMLNRINNLSFHWAAIVENEVDYISNDIFLK